MIAVFRHQQMRQHGGGGATTRSGHRRGRCLGNRIAGGAGKFGPDVPDYLEVAGHVIQHFGDILAELGHSLAAVGAFTGAVIGRVVHDLLARQMIGQRLALRLAALADRSLGFGGVGLKFGFRRDFGLSGFKFLKTQFELFDLTADAFRRAAKLHAAQFGDLQFELLDLQRLVLHRELRHFQLALAGQGEGVQFGGISGQFGRGERHVSIYQAQIQPARINTESETCQTSIGRLGGSVVIVRRQSIASTSTAICAGVNVIAPSTTGGHTKRPFSSRLASNHNPVPSQ